MEVQENGEQVSYIWFSSYPKAESNLIRSPDSCSHWFSVAYKLILSMLVLGISFLLRQWIDLTLIVLATG